jgi:hypothetical protein
LYPETVEVLAIQLSATECVIWALAVKFTPETLALLTVTLWLIGVKENPVFVGVTV